MKILSFSLDRSIIDMRSLLAKKSREYAAMTEEYNIIVPSSEECELKLDNNLRVFCVAAPNRLLLLYRMYQKARALIRERKLDILTTQDPFEFGILAMLLKWEYRIAWNVQEHGDFFSQKHWRAESVLNSVRYYLGRFLIKRADSIRVVSKRTEEYLNNFLRINKKKIIKVPVFTEFNEDEFNKRSRDPKEFLFLNMGRFVDQKNLPLLIYAFSKVHKQYKHTKLLLIGDGRRRSDLEKLINDLNLNDAIEIKDWVDNVYDYYLGSDAYVLSSNYEGWGRVIIEAAATKLPIIMTDVGCAGEVIKDSESGLVVPVGNSEELAKAMLMLVEDSYLRRRLAEKAYEEIKKLPNKQETLKLYKKSWEVALEDRD